MADPTKQRLFFALWPDDRIRQGLTRVTAGLPRHGGRAPRPENLHITLVFLGEVHAERYACVLEAAGRVHSEPFELQIDQIGYWKRPRILWCGPSDTPDSLIRLVSDLQRALKDCGFRPERRPYSPHFTLARKARAVDSEILAKPLSWSLREFVLVASHTEAGGPRYQVLKKWPLGS